MDAEELASLLATLGLPPDAAVAIHGGWASWTFRLDSDRILRVARDDTVAASHRREARLLPELAAAVDFAVPEPLRVAEHRGRTYMTYRRLPGRALRPTDDTVAVAGILRQLHGFPVSRAAELLGDTVDPDSWHDGYAADREWIETRVLPVLDAPTRDLVARRFDAALRGLRGVPLTLVHRDLGTEHILVNDAGRPTGVIDFEDACVGDPAIDFIGILITLGAKQTRRIARHCEHRPDWDRLWFYWWMGAVHAIRYGVDQDDPDIVAEGVQGLTRRIAAPPT